MDKIMNIICWKWKPLKGTPSTKKKTEYTSDHVNALHEMLKKHVSLPFQLHCVTDDPDGIDKDIETIPLWDEFRELGGCYVRLVCFKEDFRLFGDHFLSIDLDCVIMSNIDHLLQREEDFIIWTPEGGMFSRRSVDYCGGLWMLAAGSRPEIYDSFDPSQCKTNRRGRYPGGTDQRQISKFAEKAGSYGQKDGIYNFMPDINPTPQVKLSQGTAIIFFNGPYLPDDPGLSNFSWIKEHYPRAGRGKQFYNFNLIQKKQERAKRRNKMEERVLNTPYTIVLYWWDNWPDPASPELGEVYIRRLVAGIEKHAPKNKKYKIILYTDNPKKRFKGVEVRKLDVPWDLRWNLKKMYMYSEKAELKGPVLCLDLDCIIVGDLSPLLRQIFLLSLSKKKILLTCQGVYKNNRPGGSVIGFYPCNKLNRLLWQPVKHNQKEIENITKGSERKYFKYALKKRQMAYWESLVSDKVLSYKRDCKEGLPKGVSIVRFHGSPRPHEVEDNWIKEHWGD